MKNFNDSQNTGYYRQGTIDKYKIFTLALLPDHQKNIKI